MVKNSGSCFGSLFSSIVFIILSFLFCTRSYYTFYVFLVKMSEAALLAVISVPEMSSILVVPFFRYIEFQDTYVISWSVEKYLPSLKTTLYRPCSQNWGSCMSLQKPRWPFSTNEDFEAVWWYRFPYYFLRFSIFYMKFLFMLYSPWKNRPIKNQKEHFLIQL